MSQRPPVFLERAGYRLRRAKDAARFLPVIGAFLFLMPLVWAGGATRRGVVYIFVIWLGLIIGAALLSRVLRDKPRDGAEKEQEGL